MKGIYLLKTVFDYPLNYIAGASSLENCQNVFNIVCDHSILRGKMRQIHSVSEENKKKVKKPD